MEQSHTPGQYWDARSIQSSDHNSTLTVGPAEYSNIIETMSVFDYMIDLTDQELQLIFFLAPESDRFKGFTIKSRYQGFFHSIHIMANAGIGQV